MICRLCLNNVENYFGFFDSKGIALNAAQIISRHFWFQPKQDDSYSKSICEKCWELVNNFHVFYILVEDAHKILKDIKSDYFDDKLSIVNSKVDEQSDLKDTLVPSYVNTLKLESYDLLDESSSSKNCVIETTVGSQKFNINKEKNRRRSERHKNLKSPKKFESKFDSCIDTITLETESKSKLGTKEKHLKTSKEIATLDTKKKYVFFTDEQIAKIRTLNCNNCSVKISTFYDLKKHMDEAHGENGYAVCCDKKFFKRYKFVNHLQMHLNPEEFKCPHCDKRLGSKKYIKLHIRNMHTELGKMKKFSCDQCDKTFAQKAYLERHKLGHIPDCEKHFACENCGNRFPTAALLRVHTLNVHESRHSAICDLCGKKYKSPADLKRHRLEHMGIHEPKVQCEICGDWLSNKYKLKRHMLKHTTTDIEHRCTICNKVSANLLAFKSHMRLHISVRKFQCSICEKGFRRSLNLKEHMTTHTGEALYSCPNCPRTFTHHSNLHHHRKKMHPKELEEDRKLKYLKIENYNKTISMQNVDETKLENYENDLQTIVVRTDLMNNSSSINEISTNLENLSQ